MCDGVVVQSNEPLAERRCRHKKRADPEIGPFPSLGSSGNQLAIKGGNEDLPQFGDADLDRIATG
jgi:hypothetical protein